MHDLVGVLDELVDERDDLDRFLTLVKAPRLTLLIASTNVFYEEICVQSVHDL